ncbi:hypothetical protein MTR_4g082200 [Medicago truncatula]|uniref:Uncharacterized protein n=1 Tax=Medicago truncatula TaxID=3880 RepID=G7JGA3_MEDTR|nr:hypothetical protein MTR_4g082200 [Medicago truncatula]
MTHSHLFFTYEFSKIVLKGAMQSRAEPPPASLGASQDLAFTFFVASPIITRIPRFSCGFICGFYCKFCKKHISCKFCQGFRFPGKRNTFAGNCFVRILGSAGKVYPREGSNIVWEVYKIIRMKCAIFVQAL